MPDGQAADALVLQALAARRLRQITGILGLDPDHFTRAHDAAQKALDGSRDRIMSEQSRRVAEALLDIPDGLVRARIVGLMAALADDEAPDPVVE